MRNSEYSQLGCAHTGFSITHHSSRITRHDRLPMQAAQPPRTHHAPSLPPWPERMERAAPHSGPIATGRRADGAGPLGGAATGQPAPGRRRRCRLRQRPPYSTADGGDCRRGCGFAGAAPNHAGARSTWASGKG